MTIYEWTFDGQTVEVDCLVHKRILASQHGPEEPAFVEIGEIKRDGRAIQEGEWDQFIEEDLEAFQESVLEGRR